MGKYYLTDGSYLVAVGECPDGLEELQAYNGLTVALGEPPSSLARRETPPPAYDKLRAQAYPEIGAQLDMIWHAMDDGLIPKIEPLYSEIKAVKAQYPKTAN